MGLEFRREEAETKDSDWPFGVIGPWGGVDKVAQRERFKVGKRGTKKKGKV